MRLLGRELLLPGLSDHGWREPGGIPELAHGGRARVIAAPRDGVAKWERRSCENGSVGFA